jgi:hypothetical protein
MCSIGKENMQQAWPTGESYVQDVAGTTFFLDLCLSSTGQGNAASHYYLMTGLQIPTIVHFLGRDDILPYFYADFRIQINSRHQTGSLGNIYAVYHPRQMIRHDMIFCNYRCGGGCDHGAGARTDFHQQSTGDLAV